MSTSRRKIHQRLSPNECCLPVKGSAQSRLCDKLHPSRFLISPKMTAIVGYILGETYVDPPIWEMVVTSDGFVLARVGGHVGCDTFIGSYSDLYRNWMRLLNAAELTDEEQIEAQCRFAELVGFYSEVTA